MYYMEDINMLNKKSIDDINVRAKEYYADVILMYL